VTLTEIEKSKIMCYKNQCYKGLFVCCSNGNVHTEAPVEPVSAPSSVDTEKAMEQPEVQEQPPVMLEPQEPEKTPEPEPQHEQPGKHLCIRFIQVEQ